MVYFDRDYLKQYLDIHKSFKVRSNGLWYVVSSIDELEDDETLVPCDEFGISHYIDYISIDAIKLGGNTLTKDQLQQIHGIENPDETNQKPASKKSDSDSPDEEEPKAKPEPGQQNANYDPYRIGYEIIRDTFKR